MTALPYTVQHTVASHVAHAWVKRGVKSYAYEDMYQDAVEVMHLAVRRYRPEKGKLEAYLHRACVLKLCGRITRAAQPVSSRSNDDIPELRKVQRVPLTPTFVHESRRAAAVDCDTAVLRAQIRRRLVAVAETVPEGETALAIMLGTTSVGELTDDPARAQRLYYCVRRMKKAIREDHALAEMHKDS
jgi:hypothetical protein